MLPDSKLIAFVASAKPLEAKRFYGNVLGFTLVEESQFALVFETGGTTIRVQKVERVVAPGYTALGWQVGNIDNEVEHLSKRGVAFERFAHLPQDDAGIWLTPDGSKVAWFRDPDGNTLSLTEPQRRDA